MTRPIRETSVLLATLGGVQARPVERRLARIVTLDAEIGPFKEQAGVLSRASVGHLTDIRGAGPLAAVRVMEES